MRRSATRRSDDVLLVANENSPAQVVISGSVPAIERAESAREEPTDPRGATVGRRRVPLSVDGARARGDRRADRRDRVLAAAAPDRGERAGTLVTDAEELRRVLKRHVVSPVRWESCVRALADAGATSFLEAGPGDVLVKLMKRIVPHAAARAIGSPEDARAASGTAAGS